MHRLLRRLFEVPADRRARRAAAARRRRSRPFAVEALEHRAVPAADLVAGVLNITGTDGNDRIAVRAVDANLEVRINRETFTFVSADVATINIDALAGDDRIRVDSKVLQPTTIHGGADDDVIYGGGGDDTIHGDDGDDRIYGGDGQDDLSGDAGDDRLDGGADDDALHGGADDDVLHGGKGDDDVFGDEDDDRAFGDAGDDSVSGGDGDDRLDGGADDDTVEGGTGRDNLTGGRGRDRLRDDGAGNTFRHDGEDEADELHNNGSSSAEWEVQLAGAPYRAEAKFESEVDDGRVKETFIAGVRGAAPGDVLDVTVGGVLAGQITVNNQGIGRLVLSSFPDGVKSQPFPTGFPQITAGVTVVIGAATGDFGAPNTGGQSFELEAELRSGAFRASANFESEVEGAVTENQFRAFVKVGPPGTTVDVTVDDVVVGQINIDGQGRGQLMFSTKTGPAFPGNFPTVKAGSKIKIGPAAGTLGTAGAVV